MNLSWTTRHTVQLYKCFEDRESCSRCLSPESTPPYLNCQWCGNTCAHVRSSRCTASGISPITQSSNYPCDAPIITDVSNDVFISFLRLHKNEPFGSAYLLEYCPYYASLKKYINTHNKSHLSSRACRPIIALPTAALGPGRRFLRSAHAGQYDNVIPCGCRIRCQIPVNINSIRAVRRGGGGCDGCDRTPFKKLLTVLFHCLSMFLFLIIYGQNMNKSIWTKLCIYFLSMFMNIRCELYAGSYRWNLKFDRLLGVKTNTFAIFNR